MLDLKTSRQTITLVFISLFLISPTEAKNSESFELPKSKLLLNIEFTDEAVLPYQGRLISLVDTAFKEYTKLFGGPPRKLDGSPYTELNIKLSTGFGGEADPEFIDFRISDLKLFGFYNWEIALLHEVLHLWSAETFRYIDDQEQWFNEGVTDYLAFRLAAKLGIIKNADVLNTFSKPMGTYLSAKGISVHSLRSAGSTDQLKREHYFLVYHGGFVAGMVLDHQIRSKSKGRFTLNNLMSELYKTHSRDKLYSSESILTLINKSMGLDLGDFFERYIDGNQIIPVGRYFDIGELIFSKQSGRSISANNQQVLADMLTFE